MALKQFTTRLFHYTSRSQVLVAYRSSVPQVESPSIDSGKKQVSKVTYDVASNTFRSVHRN